MTSRNQFLNCEANKSNLRYTSHSIISVALMDRDIKRNISHVGTKFLGHDDLASPQGI